MSRIAEVRSGGQSGADRGAMDAAQERGVPVTGWCPAGGWAEDFPYPPGVRALYPQMVETPLRDVAQRTEWNIRDSTCCIVLNTRERGASPGTDIGYAFYEKYGIPHFEIEIDGSEPIELQVDRACAWLQALDDDAIVLGIGGPRESEYPGIYDISHSVIGAILERFAQPPRALVVGIAGGSGSGKTTFATRLRDWFGEDAVVLSHDDYYKHRPDMTVAEAAVYNFDSPDALDTDLLAEHLRTLKNGKAIDVPSYNFATHERTEHARHIEPVPIVIVEGLLIAAEPELRSQFDLLVFIDSDADVRALRRIKRDCEERGATLQRAIAMYLGTTKRAQELYVEPFRNTADILVPNAMSGRALETVAQGIAARMSQIPRFD